jgi:amino acid transporter
MDGKSTTQRSIGLWGAVSIGVGAIVGGGILALAGVAFAAAGAAAIVAFALNGVLALVTALSFAELASAFPQSGGVYTFAKKVLSVETAFAVGWVAWFASIAAGVLYSLGFGYFAVLALEPAVSARLGQSPPWLSGQTAVASLAVAAIVFYSVHLVRKAGGGAGHLENIGKLAVFAVLIAGGFWALAGRPVETVTSSLRPFFSGGTLGLFQAMGFTFIALQGFDLIAAAGGEIRDPRRTIPRAMFASLGIALLVYLPLLFVVAAAGTEPGQSIADASKANPENVVAVAAGHFLGPFGYWLVIVAGLLSMLSALRANLFAASRVAAAMARDRTLPYALSLEHPERGTPAAAVLATGALTAAIVILVPNVAAAGAVSSLVFLGLFTLSHWICILAGNRSGRLPSLLKRPWFPALPVVGMIACFVLAAYEGAMVPSAGLIVSAWLGVGGILFLGLLARPARVVDALAEAQDPDAARLRGRTPLVLVPIANPNNAQAMVAIANALAPPQVGRVLLLSVAVLPKGWKAGDRVLAIRHAQLVLGDALAASVEAGLFPEALATVAADPWEEINRVARLHRCESLLLGFTALTKDQAATPLEVLVPRLACDVVILRAPQGWQLSEAHQILVPIGGRGVHDRLRARLLGSLFRTRDRKITLLKVLPESADAQACTRARKELARIARDEAPGHARVLVVQNNNLEGEIIGHAAQSDLVVLGLHRPNRRQTGFGRLVPRIARETPCPMLMISHRS